MQWNNINKVIVFAMLFIPRMSFSLLPITFSEWGQLYSQTTEITIPFIDNQVPPIILITSSIISAVECSLTEPTYFDITPNSYPKDDIQ
ncbi:hypothetical protein [Xenorhabdus bovienii]|uniref:hypothetical protein n=1 Tax=Xenorhabdus bovienii TaxID=40576 RepID=UPI0023B28DEA|nr:hypothetical protein [Xenorhabdus bovienii]MDE9429014.1 hypothetical protein [Xenorhabdus bovienii]